MMIKPLHPADAWEKLVDSVLISIGLALGVIAGWVVYFTVMT